MRTKKRSPRRGWTGSAASLGFFALAVLAIAVVSPPLEKLLQDLMTATVSPFTAPKGGIVVVALTEKTLAGFPYRSPVDRGFLADLITRIRAGQPRVIGLDLLIDQPTEARKDGRLRSVIEAAGPPVVIASASESDGLTQAQAGYLRKFAPSAKHGIATLLHDNLDGVVRSTFPGRESKSGWEPGFVSAIGGAVGIDTGRRPRPMVYYRTAGSGPFRFPLYPADAAILVPPAWFKGKIVLIGTVLPGEDRHPTPFSLLDGPRAGDLPGVMIHTNALAAFLSGDSVRTPWTIAGVLPFVLSGLLCMWIAWSKLPPLLKPAAVLGVLAVVWTANVLVFSRLALVMPTVAPTLGVLVLSGYAGFLAWRRDESEREFVEEAFSRYVSPDVVAEIMRKPKALGLGGRQRTITSVFTDLEGFTPLGEALEPEALANFLNDYLDGICDLFVGHGATIDKVVGDAVVGFLGAPLARDDQPERAVALALAVEEFGRKMQAEMAGRGLSVGRTRIGVHQGPAVVGNFGGKRFFNYTAVGKTVNIAARLESASAFVGARNCISAEVALQASGFLVRPIGVLRLKGIGEGVGAYEAMHRTQENQRLIEQYSEAYALLASGAGRAHAAFAGLALEFPDDGLVRFHRNRLAEGRSGTAICVIDNQGSSWVP